MNPEGRVRLLSPFKVLSAAEAAVAVKENP
jgi:hypothetical protein